MAQSIEKNIKEAKLNRSRSISQKINVLYSRDGSDAPPIESLKEKDEFHMKLFFGKSASDSIDWEHPGVEGIVRMYYEIIYRLNGKIRNNIIKAGENDDDNSAHNTTVRSSLDGAAKAFTDGNAYEYGFFIGWEGLQRDINNASGRHKSRLTQAINMGRRGDFDVPMTDDWSGLASKLSVPDVSTTFTTNRDDSPDDDETKITYLIQQVLDLIGDKSQLGPFGPYSSQKSLSDFISLGFVDDTTVMGRRFTDICPEDEDSEYYSYTDPDTGQTVSGWNYEYTYGNGYWDSGQGTGNCPSGVTSYFDYWNEDIHTKLNQILTLFDEIIQFIEYSKVQDDTYLINPDIPPGKDSAWAMQNSWISIVESYKAIIQQFLDDFSQYYSGGDSTDPAGRVYLNGRIDTFKAELQTLLSDVSDFANAIDDNEENSNFFIDAPIFGDVSDAASLWGLRFMATRMMLDATDGSKTAKESIGTAIAMMDKRLKKAEEELEMYGIPTDEWIYTPDVVGIEPHYRLNQATFEMEIAGWFVVFVGQDHCTSYNIQRSLDYDPSTEQGTWQLLIPQGQSYSQVDRDANTGTVLSYYLDTEVGPGDTPYYMAKAYDDGTGEKPFPEYDRIPSESPWSEPRSADDIEAPDYKAEKPRQVYDPSEPVRVNSAANIPPNTLAWTTNWKGDEAEDVDRTIFRSEVPFDSIGSDLMVFVNERFKNPDKNNETNDYWLEDTYRIKFHQPVAPDDEVNLHVFIRSFEGKTDCVDSWYDNYSELENDKPPGHVSYVRNDRKFYEWDGSVWSEISDPCAGDTNNWKASVQSFTKLPTIENSDGDIRLVLDENVMYRWNGNLEQWLVMSGSTGSGYWGAPVDTTDDLPDSTNNGEIRLVIEESSLYRWNAGQQQWNKLTGGTVNGAAPVWGEPVPTFANLPDPATQLNEIRLVIDEAKMYLWDAINGIWRPIYAEALLAHDDLIDMPDANGTIASHDSRYYTENEVDSFLSDIRGRVQHLEGLKPRDAQELTGDFAITGTKFYSGYLSNGNMRFDTLVPEQFFSFITKDVNFILSNNNVEQFKNADKGELILYVNDVEIDRFDLAESFNESERESGQSYPPAKGGNENIVVTSVGPYNNYPTYQRGDFELHFTEQNFESGENKITLVHKIAEVEHTTDPFIFFFDDNDSYRSFQNISVQLTTLNSSVYLSGVRYASIGDDLNIYFTTHRMFNNTYPWPKQISVDTSAFGISAFDINYESQGIVETVDKRVNEIFTFNNTLSINKSGVQEIDPSLILTPYSVFGPDPKIDWSDSGILINTISQASDATHEYFLDEVYRLAPGDYDTAPGSITGQWDGSVQLSQGDLQLYNGKLIYPQQNYDTVFPQQNVYYSGFSGPAEYYRAFYSPHPHNNGILFIEGLDPLEQNIDIYLKLPGLTGWLDGMKMYNAATFTGVDGDGVLMKAPENTSHFYFTTGQFSTANSANMIILKVVFSGNDIFTLRTHSLEEISINW